MDGKGDAAVTGADAAVKVEMPAGVEELEKGCCDDWRSMALSLGREERQGRGRRQRGVCWLCSVVVLTFSFCPSASATRTAPPPPSLASQLPNNFKDRRQTTSRSRSTIFSASLLRSLQIPPAHHRNLYKKNIIENGIVEQIGAGTM
ncbi:hypothetical protein ACFX15_030861 [Malus domestica]